MSWLGRSARPASMAALVIMFGGLVFVSLMVEGSAEPPSRVSVADAVVGSRRMLVRVNEGFFQRTLEEFKDDDPFSNSKRRVQNGPDPVHNRGSGKTGRSPGRT